MIVSLSAESLTHRDTDSVFSQFQCISVTGEVGVSISVYTVYISDSVSVPRWVQCKRISVISEGGVSVSVLPVNFSVSDVGGQYTDTGTSLKPGETDILRTSQAFHDDNPYRHSPH